MQEDSFLCSLPSNITLIAQQLHGLETESNQANQALNAQENELRDMSYEHSNLVVQNIDTSIIHRTQNDSALMTQNSYDTQLTQQSSVRDEEARHAQELRAQDAEVNRLKQALEEVGVSLVYRVRFVLLYAILWSYSLYVCKGNQITEGRAGRRN